MLLQAFQDLFTPSEAHRLFEKMESILQTFRNTGMQSLFLSLVSGLGLAKQNFSIKLLWRSDSARTPIDKRDFDPNSGH